MTLYLRSKGQMSRSAWVCTLLSASPLVFVDSLSLNGKSIVDCDEHNQRFWVNFLLGGRFIYHFCNLSASNSSAATTTTTTTTMTTTMVMMKIVLANLRSFLKLRFVDNLQIEEFVILLTALPEPQTVSPQLHTECAWNWHPKATSSSGPPCRRRNYQNVQPRQHAAMLVQFRRTGAPLDSWPNWQRFSTRKLKTSS